MLKVENPDGNLSSEMLTHNRLVGLGNPDPRRLFGAQGWGLSGEAGRGSSFRDEREFMPKTSPLISRLDIYPPLHRLFISWSIESSMETRPWEGGVDGVAKHTLPVTNTPVC